MARWIDMRRRASAYGQSLLLAASAAAARALLSLPLVAYVSGNWYPGALTPTFGAGASGAMSNAVIRMTPFIPRNDVTVTDLGARVTTLSAGGNFRLGIYASDPVTLKATGACLGSIGGLSTAATGVVSGTLAAPVALEAGKLYWLAVQVDNATAVFQAVSNGFATSAVLGDPALGTTSASAALGLNCLSAAVGYAAGMTDLTAVAQTAASNFGNALVWWKAQ